MRNIDAARIKKMLTGAEGKRLHLASARQSTGPQPSRNRDSRKAVAQLLGKGLGNLGPMRKEFAAILAKDQAKSTALLKRAKAEAVKKSRGAQKSLTQAAAQHGKALAELADLPLTIGSPEYELLNKPFLIWPTNAIDLQASEIVPSQSWAKFQFHAERTEQDALRFYYLWDNPKNKYAVINVDGYLVLHGHIQAASGGGFFPGDRYSKLAVDARLEIYEWYNQPPTSPYPQPDQIQDAGTVEINAGGWSEVGGFDVKTLFRGYDLRRTLMLVPPQATIVFAVTAYFGSTNGTDSSATDADFASGAFQVMSPAVLVTVLS